MKEIFTIKKIPTDWKINDYILSKKISGRSKKNVRKIFEINDNKLTLVTRRKTSGQRLTKLLQNKYSLVYRLIKPTTPDKFIGREALEKVRLCFHPIAEVLSDNIFNIMLTNADRVLALGSITQSSYGMSKGVYVSSICSVEKNKGFGTLFMLAITLFLQNRDHLSILLNHDAFKISVPPTPLIATLCIENRDGVEQTKRRQKFYSNVGYKMTSKTSKTACEKTPMMSIDSDTFKDNRLTVLKKNLTFKPKGDFNYIEDVVNLLEKKNIITEKIKETVLSKLS